MRKPVNLLAGAVLGVTAGISRAAIVIDGTLDPGYGSALSTQTNTSTTQFDGSGNPIDGASSNSAHVQLSNAYGLIDTANGKLDLFLGGAMNLNNERLWVFFDANPTSGVASMVAGTHAAANDTGIVPTLSDKPGNVQKSTVAASMNFDPNFRPESALELEFGAGEVMYFENMTTGVESNYGFSTDPRGHVLTRGAGATTGSVTDPLTSPQIVISASTANEGAVINSNFSSVSSGLEVQLNLADLGYVAGNPINVSAIATQQSNAAVSNQELGPNGSYTGANNYFNFNFANDTLWPGQQYFTVPAPTPEPGVMGLIGLLGMARVRRRK